MKGYRRILCVLLCLLMMMPLCACRNVGGGYRIIDTYSAEGSYVIAFRENDRISTLVKAALGELAANGTLRAASLNWFGENLISVREDAGALEEYREGLETRTITVGIDITNMPMSYQDGVDYKGFDVDLASYICGCLGWSMRIYPIDMADVSAELNSGNIDMAMGISASETKSGFSYSQEYLTSRYVLVARSSGWIRGKKALKGKNLGVVMTDIDVLQQDPKFVESLERVTYQTDTAGLFRALMLAEVDGVLVSSVVAAYYMK